MDLSTALVSYGVACIRPAIVLQMLPFGAAASAGIYLRVPLTLTLGWLAWDQRDHQAQLMAIMLKEALLGVLLGFLLNRAFSVVGMATSVLAQQASYTAGSVYDPNFERESTALDGLLLNLLSLIVFAAGGLGFLVGSMQESLVLWPIADLTPDLGKLARGLIDSLGRDLLPQMLALIMPLMVLLLFTEIILGLMGRHAQQLNPFSVSMPLKLAVLFLAIWMAFPTLVEEMVRLLEMSRSLQ
ncbi:EscT/YscT/HrcT family type III secretion system export apparatus protein [Herbaspirillum sp. YR522]|uniref:EscT/YscT/HrcT family type III secretion system export apparatus protein n=1 Tax=Herbaspirillum sp. YR522 TaxID=1144342 RepID=UPI00026FC506|nr:flagellar biosynthetic protein FliR [Herbaspirillum sp. YR522]EJN02577.1 type III secretory pathway, component EscT [Herbaspirillum sp. YR522]